MKRFAAICKWSLLIWGAISLAGVVAIAGFAAYQFTFGNRAKTDFAAPQNVRFVLNWCNLGESRTEKVIHSYQSSRSFTGDHLDAYAIKILRVTPEELTATNAASPGRTWHRGDQLPTLLDDAVRFAAMFLGDGETGEIPWFPKEAELRSNQFYVFPQSIYYYGGRPIEADLIFVRPADKMLFYFSAKT
jgi:hypothetical protein